MINILKVTLIAAMSLFANWATAQDVNLEQLSAEISKRLPDIEITSIADTPIDGVYELISAGQIYYVSHNGKFIIDGELIDLDSRTNMTQARLGSIHIGLINAVDESDMLIYEPEDPSDRSITVFTDTSCGFCRKLHAELDTLLDAGVRVRYLMFPRAGIQSASAKTLESIWCAKDPLDAMTVAKSGGSVAPASCENPIQSHMALAEQVGLRGTPLIYLCLLYTSPSPRDKRQSRMPSSA